MNIRNDESGSVFPGKRDEQYVLQLYISGMTPRSSEAIGNIKSICEEFLRGRYSLEVIDIYQQPHLAAGEQIIATPTLLKVRPAPLRRFIGNLSTREKLLNGLGLHQGKEI
jgi:circadian clock protein KaiB